ncbi:uncharacterized protein YdiU (UPF0061 family) [Rhodoligotrophos appendicifer]|uniref:protein adenylyltransferase SelO n=1 Tax=Rhodoligotrophos appendicifer TaxID=987056 RepID=UPI001186EBAD|nr:YdiU family protein [Rhodoligotrophos appendicifer]
MTGHFPFDNTYRQLPDRFFAQVEPPQSTEPGLVQLNQDLAVELGLDPVWLSTREGVKALAGNPLPSGAEPIAMAYAGHQFGHFVPQLGDGRAILLGEVINLAGERRDIQLKGSGPTPFSRRGDGKAALGPVLREYIVSEAMAALGVPTTRALAAVRTGETVYREEALPGAVLVRVAKSHIRVGTFQFFAARHDFEGVQRLADYAIARHYPELKDEAYKYRLFLEAVVSHQAELVAKWLLLGFVHGVMNTDNMSISGETIDYGPCAFMDIYNPGTVFSSIDEYGRYAYANQPAIAQWNLTRLAECLLPLDANKELALAHAQETLQQFVEQFNTAYLSGLRRKLGLFTEQEGDLALAQDLLNIMADGKADFTATFRSLCDVDDEVETDETTRTLFDEPSAFDSWYGRWLVRLRREARGISERQTAMRRVNPAYIPRNHLVEAALKAAVQENDLKPFRMLLDVLARPYESFSEFEAYARPPQPSTIAYRTFCGT